MKHRFRRYISVHSPVVGAEFPALTETVSRIPCVDTRLAFLASFHRKGFPRLNGVGRIPMPAARKKVTSDYQNGD